jgi:hypothetical protein
MTIAEFRELAESGKYPDDTILYAFDGDEGESRPVTGLLYFECSIHGPTLEFQTDIP